MFLSNCTTRWSEGLAAPLWRLIVLAAVLVLGAQPAATMAAGSPINLRAPGQPAHIHATAVDGAALLSWEAPYDNGSRITAYTVTAYLPDTNGNAVAIRTVPGDTTSLRWIGVDGPFLRPHASYAFTIFATNAFGNGVSSRSSNSITWVPGVSAPGKPQNLRATAASGSAALRWDAPDNGGSEVIGYEMAVYRGQDLFDRKLLPGHATKATLDGLDNGVGYSFTVQALNASGWGPVSDNSNAVVPETGTLDAPSNVQATAGNSSATVNWSPPYDGGSPITGYLVRAYTGWTANVAATREVLGNATSVTMMGIDRPLLANGTIYTFTVQARNANGWGPESVRSNAATPGPSLAQAPTDVHAEVSGNDVNLTWSAPFDGGSAITKYVIRTYLATSPQVISERIVDANATRTTITGLTGGTDYSFTIFAVNALGWGPESSRSNVVHLAPVPSAPKTVQATAGIGSVVVSWLPSAFDGRSPITGYTVTAYQGGTTDVVTTVTVDQNTTSVYVALANGGTYTFAVQAVNAVGLGAQSARSNSVTLPTIPSAPLNLTATADDSSTHLSWDAPTSDGGMPVDHYAISASDGIHDPIATTSTGTSVTLTGLTNGITYTVKVVAVNKVGQGSPASISVMARNLPPTLQIPGDQRASYSDKVAFDISTRDPEVGDHITLNTSSLPAGLSFADRGDGTGSVSGTVQVPVGVYPITFSASDGHNPAVTQTLTLTVTAKTAVVTLPRSNPAVFTVVKASSRTRSVALQASLAAPAGSSQGDISKIGAVTYRLTGLGSGITRSCTAGTSGGMEDGVLQTQCRFRNLPVGAYRMDLEASSGYYHAATEGRLMVDYPARSAVWGQGAVDRGEGEAPLSFHASFDRHGRLAGQLTYAEHGAHGDMSLRSTRIDGLVIKGNVAYIAGRATLNGGGSYRFIATIDRSDGDQFGLWVGDAGNGTNPDLTFESVDLTSGQTGMRR